MENNAKAKITLFVIRLVLGFIFLWAFFDKLLGLGFATTPDKAWIVGGSPTYGFLKLATYGVFAQFYQAIAGTTFVNVTFMLALLLLGIALLLGICMRTAGYGGALLMILMWSARLPPEQNPVFDEHIVYALVLILLTLVNLDELSIKRLWRKKNKGNKKKKG